MPVDVVAGPTPGVTKLSGSSSVLTLAGDVVLESIVGVNP